MQRIFALIQMWFHKEVDDILKPLNKAIVAVEAFEKKTVTKAIDAKMYVAWAEAEIAKAQRVKDRLRDLVS